MNKPATREGSRSVAGVLVAAASLALVGWSVLHAGAGAARDEQQARHVMGTDAARMSPPAEDATR